MVLVVAGVWFFLGEKAEAPSLLVFTFVDEAGESIDVSFDSEARIATLNGRGYSNLVFNQATSASGARYENAAEGLVLWNKGEDITLYRGDETLFTGSTAPAEAEVVTEEEASTPAVSRKGIFDSKWVWLFTDSAADGRVMAPEGGRFVLSLSSDGHMSSVTDCNTLNGSLILNGDALSFGPLLSTKMFCADSKEQVYGDQLSEVSSYFINGDILQLKLKDNAGVMYFGRQ